mgnify:FL=1
MQIKTLKSIYKENLQLSKNKINLNSLRQNFIIDIYFSIFFSHLLKKIYLFYIFKETDMNEITF